MAATSTPAYLTKKDVSQRIARHPEWVSGVIEALEIETTHIGKAICLTPTQFARLSSVAKRHPRNADAA